MEKLEQLTWGEFVRRYTAKQHAYIDELWDRLNTQEAMFQPDGWFMAECQELDSSSLGSLTILPFGPRNTFKTIPDAPFSPRGLASDMSVAVSWIPASEFPTVKPPRPKEYTTKEVGVYLSLTAKKINELVRKEKLIARNTEEPRFTGYDVNTYCQARGLSTRLEE